MKERWKPCCRNRLSSYQHTPPIFLQIYLPFFELLFCYFYNLFRNFFFLVHYHPLQPTEPEIIPICSSHIHFFPSLIFPFQQQSKKNTKFLFFLFFFCFWKIKTEKSNQLPNSFRSLDPHEKQKKANNNTNAKFKQPCNAQKNWTNFTHRYRLRISATCLVRKSSCAAAAAISTVFHLRVCFYYRQTQHILTHTQTVGQHSNGLCRGGNCMNRIKQLTHHSVTLFQTAYKKTGLGLAKRLK